MRGFELLLGFYTIWHGLCCLMGVDSFSCRKNERWVMEEIQCEEVRKKLPDYRERLLKHPEKGQIERHLFYCPECIFQLALVTARSLDKVPTIV